MLCWCCKYFREVNRTSESDFTRVVYLLISRTNLATKFPSNFIRLAAVSGIFTGTKDRSVITLAFEHTDIRKCKKIIILKTLKNWKNKKRDKTFTAVNQYSEDAAANIGAAHTFTFHLLLTFDFNSGELWSWPIYKCNDEGHSSVGLKDVLETEWQTDGLDRSLHFSI